MQNDTQHEPVAEELGEMKKKMGRPRIHPTQPPKEKKSSLYLDDRKACFRQYYSMHTKTILVCPTCGSELLCQSSYNIHARTNNSCMILRLQQLIKDANENHSFPKKNKIENLKIKTYRLYYNIYTTISIIQETFDLHIANHIMRFLDHLFVSDQKGSKNLQIYSVLTLCTTGINGRVYMVFKR